MRPGRWPIRKVVAATGTAPGAGTFPANVPAVGENSQYDTSSGAGHRRVAERVYQVGRQPIDEAVAVARPHQAVVVF